MKRTMITLLTILIGLVVLYFGFTTLSPNFGNAPSKEKQKNYKVSSQFKNGKFHNKKAVPKDLNFKETIAIAYKFFTTKVVNDRPKSDLQVSKLDSTKVDEYNEEARMFWFGHSSFLLQVDGKNILLDPMFGKVAAPHPLLGADRFNKKFPLEVEKIPEIDAVLFSHDHYDHLDYETILKIKDKTKHFFLSFGVGTHLEAWGVATEKITELDWWKETNYEGLTFICTPAQHFSGRKFNTGQTTLWSSWVIQSKTDNIYFSGDSGYANHFKEIGDKYGPFDLALLECGQYNESWADIHMMPEETAQAGIDLKAKKAMPIHWGGFKLALHDWTDPIQRIQAEAEKLELKVITPKIGQEILVKDSLQTFENWWVDL